MLAASFWRRLTPPMMHGTAASTLGALIAREAGAALLSLETGDDAAWDERQVIIGNPAVVRDALRVMPGLVRPHP